MIKKIVVCPNCKGKIEVTNENDLQFMQVKCPNPVCPAQIRIDFTDDLNKTQIGASSGSNTKIGSLRLGSRSVSLAGRQEYHWTRSTVVAGYRAVGNCRQVDEPRACCHRGGAPEEWQGESHLFRLATSGEGSAPSAEGGRRSGGCRRPHLSFPW